MGMSETPWSFSQPAFFSSPHNVVHTQEYGIGINFCPMYAAMDNQLLQL
jgi:hypothetical protein